MEEFPSDDIVQGTPYHNPDTTNSTPPYIMTAMEQNFLYNFKATLNNLVTKGDNMETDKVNQSTRTYSASSQDSHPFILPVIHLFKKTQKDIELSLIFFLKIFAKI